jgi:hypothetical protein
VASLDDYRHAHDAFDGGLGRLYKVKTPETALAVVRAVEAMGATRDAGIKVSVRTSWTNSASPDAAPPMTA